MNLRTFRMWLSSRLKQQKRIKPSLEWIPQMIGPASAGLIRCDAEFVLQSLYVPTTSRCSRLILLNGEQVFKKKKKANKETSVLKARRSRHPCSQLTTETTFVWNNILSHFLFLHWWRYQRWILLSSSVSSKRSRGCFICTCDGLSRCWLTYSSPRGNSNVGLTLTYCTSLWWK